MALSSSARKRLEVAVTHRVIAKEIADAVDAASVAAAGSATTAGTSATAAASSATAAAGSATAAASSAASIHAATAIADIATVDADDPTTTQALANINKAKINALLAALRVAGLLAT